MFQHAVLECLIHVRLMVLQDINEVQEVFRYIKVIIDHVRNLFLGHLVQFIGMHGFIFSTTTQHQLESRDCHLSLFAPFSKVYLLVHIFLRCHVKLCLRIPLAYHTKGRNVKVALRVVG